ncbi:MAG: tyrosine-type recombinase/integrase [Coriobacteriales bacterium]|jgi:integrase|nr:tyrosine-type recombinase/integrase [Coriobacteriales bacterium]
MKNTTRTSPPEKAGDGKRVLDEYLAGILDDYTDSISGKSLSEKSVSLLRYKAQQFFFYLMDHKTLPSSLDRACIAGYWASCGKRLSHSTMGDLRYALGSLLPYLAASNITSEDLSIALPPTVTGRTTRIKSLYSDEEVAGVLAAIDRATVAGKRDYAMILLGVTAALRAWDIVRLKVTDIDWAHSRITLVLHKNRRLHTIALLPDLGNAILDYLLNGRPVSDCPYLFLRLTRPYRELESSSQCASILGRRMKDAGIDSHGRSRGFHVFRVHAASRLLANGVPLSNISGFLGHRSPTSIKPYLSVDVDGMRSCALTLDGIEISQGGF